MFAALCVYSVDIAPNGVMRWSLEVWMTSCEKVDEYRIGNNVHRAITFCYPFRDAGTDIDLC